MKTIFFDSLPMCLFIGLSIFLTVNLNSQTGWYQVSSGTTQNLYDCQFINSNTGYVVGGQNAISGIILKTTNGGLNWQSILTLSYSLRGIFFVDSLIGFSSPFGGPIKKTTNGGISWLDQTSPLSNNYNLRRLYFINSNTGWIVGGNEISASGAVIYTSDGGTSWITRFNVGEDLFYDVHFFDANTGLVVGIGAQGLFRTTNGGMNWIDISSAGAGGYSMNFLDQNTGLIGGSDYLSKTTNSGTNWNVTPWAASLLSVECIDLNNYVSVGNNGNVGVIIRTTNSGINWVSQVSNSNLPLRKVTFLDLQTGWAVGDTGTILRTTTGGFTFLEPISTEIPKNYSLTQNFPNPFNPSTKIEFSIPITSFTKLTIFDLSGKIVITLINEKLSAGKYSINWNSGGIASGIYFYRIEAGKFVQSKKMVVLK